MNEPAPSSRCTQCGTVLAAGTRFCESCGTPVVASAPSVPSEARHTSPAWTILIALVVAATGFVAISQREHLLGLFQKRDAPPVATTPAAATNDDAVETIEDNEEASSWLKKQPWLVELRQKMPRGVGVFVHAEPYDAGGWSEVDVRETHSADSGFEPNVSPMIGLFRISKPPQRIEWLEPVSGEFVPLKDFLQHWGLKSGGTAKTPQNTKSSASGVVGGDFESPASVGKDNVNAVIVADPTAKGNHVARIIGPDEMSLDLPLPLPTGTPETTIALRVLLPTSTKLIRFDDGRTPEGIRLRVRLVNDIGNSIIRDAIVRPIDQWREMEFSFYDLPKKVVSVSVEAIWMEGPVYFDDVKLIPTKP